MPEAAAAAAPKKFVLQQYKTEVHVDWCPGCGDFGILSSIQQALYQLQIPPYKIAMISGIGCSGKTPHYIDTYGLHTLHGRALPVATGAKLANNQLTVVAVGGDGDGYGIGAGYFVNSGRRNVDMTYIVFNNGVYGLTKGQASPTLAKGLKTKSMPEASIQEGVNPIALALGAGYTWIGRGYALDVKNLVSLVVRRRRHRSRANPAPGSGLDVGPGRQRSDEHRRDGGKENPSTTSLLRNARQPGGRSLLLGPLADLR